MALEPGTKIGPYEIASAIGAGGMGEVYRARDTRLNRDVALKFLPQLFANDPERLMRFEREAQALAALNHPRIAAIYGLEHGSGPTEQTSRALVMELVPGEDLSARIARGPIAIDEALLIARQIAEALEAAHEAGIVHRDLKPGNVRVDGDGNVKVLDFGLAKAIDDAGAVSGASGGSALAFSPTLTSPAMTMRGVILGTAAYMSPEQAKGKPVDRRADIWAFGCVLYEMLTGRQTFDGEDITEVLGSIIKTEPDWTRLPEETPPRIRTLLKRCLARDRTQRLQHIGDARLELEAEEPTITPTVESGRPRSARLAWSVAAVMALAAVGAIAFALRPAPEVREMRLEIATPPTGSPYHYAISPDGRAVVFVALAENRPVLWLRPLDADSARPLAGTDNAAFPFWSPDSRTVAFFANGQLKRLDVAGGTPQVIAPVVSARGGAWSQQGVIVFAATPSSGLSRVAAGGGNPEPLTELGNATSHRFPVFLPDGEHFLYVEQTGGSPSYTILVASLREPHGQRLIDGVETGVTYSPAGFLLFGSEGALYAQRFDTKTLTLEGERFQAVRQTAGAVGPASVAANGNFVYRTALTGATSRLAWRDRSGKLLDPAFDFGGNEPELSADGRRSVVIRGTGDNNDLWLIDLGRTLATRFTSEPGTELWPQWSPDGTKVAYGKGGDLFVRALDGTQEELLESERGQKFPSDWSRDGRFLLFRTVGSVSDVWAVALTGDRKPFPVVASAFEETRGQFSPDGRWVSYESNQSGAMEIFIRPFNRAGAPVQISIGGGSEARWHPNGREIFYIGTGSRMMAADLRPSADGQSLDPTSPRELFTTNIRGGGHQAPNFKFQYAVSADGDKFLINEALEDATLPPLLVVLNWKAPS